MLSLRHGTQGLAAAAVLLTVAASAGSWGGPGPDPGSHLWTAVAFGVAVAMVALIRLAPPERPRQRTAWRVVEAAFLLFAVAAVWLRLGYRDGHSAPVPSPPDGLLIAAYVGLIVGLVLLFYRPAEEAPRSASLDGVLLGLAVATVAEATVLDRYVWAAGEGGLAPRAFSLAYPLLDLCLLGTIAALAGADVWTSWRWRSLAIGASLMLVADIAYLRRVAGDDLSPGAWYHPLYLLAGLAFVLAAWSPAPTTRHRRVEATRMVVLPGGVAAVSAVVLVWDHFDPRSDLAIWLATLALVGVALRAWLTVQYLHQLVDARRLALTDDLTGLPNRRFFLDALERAVQAAPSGGLAVLVLGIDRFKDLNDTLGHHVGDQVLRDCAARLVTALAVGDLVARLGGDEFAVLAVGGAPGAERAAAAVGGAFVTPIVVGDMGLAVDVSIGGAICPDDGHSVPTLLRHADVALQEAKRSELRWRMYRPDQDRYSLQRLSLASDLRAAIIDGQLRVAYQPIADVRTGRFWCAEALVRWEHPAYGELQPGQFLDIAQQTGSLRALTGFVLDAALEQSQRWRDASLDLGVSVNLPPNALLDPRLPATVRAALDRSGVPPERLVLELTENGLLDDPDTALSILRALRELGVKLAIDDYGTGYASLSYLRDLPVQYLKIDRSFVTGIGGDTPADEVSRNTAIVRSTIVLAHELRFGVVAEGVETAGTLGRLEAWGIDAVQGYLIARPVPGDALPEALRSWDRRRAGRFGTSPIGR